MLRSTSKFFKDSKIARARRASAISGYWKIYQCLFMQREYFLVHARLRERSCYLLIIHIKSIPESQDRRNFVGARAICNFHSCYMKIHSFSANQMHVIFSVYIIINYVRGRLLLVNKWSSSRRYGFLSPLQLNK